MILYTIGAVLLLVAAFFYFRVNSAAACYQNLPTEEFKKLLKENKDAVVLDVRTADEYNSGKIPNSININVLQAKFQSEVAKLDKTKPYFVYCKSGMRSVRASQILCTLGFEKVYNLSGGYSAWK